MFLEFVFLGCSNLDHHYCVLIPMFLLCDHLIVATRAIRTSMNFVSFGRCPPSFHYSTREQRALSLEVSSSLSLQNQFARVSWLLSLLWNIRIIFQYIYSIKCICVFMPTKCPPPPPSMMFIPPIHTPSLPPLPSSPSSIPKQYQDNGASSPLLGPSRPLRRTSKPPLQTLPS